MEPRTETLSTRARLMAAGGRMRMTATDGITALMFAAAAVSAYLYRTTPLTDPLRGVQEELGLAMMIEGGFALLSATLVDIATRVRKRPPLWAVILIAVVVFVFYGGLDVLKQAWAF